MPFFFLPKVIPNLKYLIYLIARVRVLVPDMPQLPEHWLHSPQLFQTQSEGSVPEHVSFSTRAPVQVSPPQ